MKGLTEFISARLEEEETSATALLVDLEAQVRDNGFGADERGPFTPFRMLSAQLWAHYDGQTQWRNFARGQQIAALADPARALAQVEAMRRIVAMYAGALHAEGAIGALPDGVEREVGLAVASSTRIALEATVRLFAAVHADHPDFDPSWRVD